MMQTKNPMEFFRNLPPKQCTECGTTITEQAESYLLECDHCLSKKDEY
ncbi:protein YhfH [Bacillus sp. mrc49]